MMRPYTVTWKLDLLLMKKRSIYPIKFWVDVPSYVPKVFNQEEIGKLIEFLFDASLGGYYIEEVYTDKHEVAIQRQYFYVRIAFKKSDKMRTNITDKVIGWFERKLRKP